MGIAGIEVFIPDGRLSSNDIARQSGVPLEVVRRKQFSEKPVLDRSVPMLSMAIQAVSALLARHSIDACDIEVLIHASTGQYDHRFWSPAAALQHTLGLQDVFSFEITCGCHAGNAGLGLVTNYLKGNRSKRYGILVVNDALSRVVDHSRDSHLPIFNFADCASAILIDSQSAELCVLAQHATTDGRFSDYLRLGSDGKIIYRQPDLRGDLKESYKKNYAAVIAAAADKAGVSIQQINYVVMNQGDPELLPLISESLAIDPSRFIRTCDNLGHMGGSDIFYGLKRLLEAGLLQRGDLLAMASSAIGFSWGASILQV